MSRKRVVHPWTDEEIGLLVDLAHMSAPKAAEELGRTVSAIRNARHRLRVGWSPTAERWTQDETDFVRRTVHLTAEEIAAHLDRSAESVRGMRARLARWEGLSFGNANKSPNNVGPRRLLAKTCIGCGMLLDATWYSYGHQAGKKWPPHCTRCFGHRNPSRKVTPEQRAQRDASTRKSLAKVQAYTRERADRHREPWVEADHEVLRNPDLTHFEKALRLKRTYLATSAAVAKNGYTSRVGKGDPMRGVWVIDNPNEPAVNQAA